MFKYMNQKFTNRVGDIIDLLTSFPGAEIWRIDVEQKTVELKHAAEDVAIVVTFDQDRPNEYSYRLVGQDLSGVCLQHRYYWMDDIGLVDNGPIRSVRVGDVLQLHASGVYYDAVVKEIGIVVMDSSTDVWAFQQRDRMDRAILLTNGDVVADFGLCHRFSIIRDGKVYDSVVINNVAGYRRD